MKRVLITGITGYIGSNLSRRLLPDYEVYGLVREPLNMTYLSDIKEKIQFLFYDGTQESMAATLKACQPDLVYHLATFYTGAHGPEQTPKLVASNITMGAYLLEAMADCGCSALVYASTIMAHYQRREYCPLNLYAATKQAFSDLLAYYTDAGLLRAVTLVISDTYGPGDYRPKILNLVKQAVESGERIALSSGRQIYDVVYIDDVVSAFQTAGKCLLQGKFHNDVFQVAPDEPVSLRETVEKMLQVNDLTLDAGWGERPPAEREITTLIRLYPTPPGWKPNVSLEEGLKNFFNEKSKKI